MGQATERVAMGMGMDAEVRHGFDSTAADGSALLVRFPPTLCLTDHVPVEALGEAGRHWPAGMADAVGGALDIAGQTPTMDRSGMMGGILPEASDRSIRGNDP